MVTSPQKKFTSDISQMYLALIITINYKWTFQRGTWLEQSSVRSVHITDKYITKPFTNSYYIILCQTYKFRVKLKLHVNVPPQWSVCRRDPQSYWAFAPQEGRSSTHTGSCQTRLVAEINTHTYISWVVFRHTRLLIYIYLHLVNFFIMWIL